MLCHIVCSASTSTRTGSMHKNVVELLKIVEERGLAVGRSAALSKMMYDGNWKSCYKDNLLVITQLSSRLDVSRSIPGKFQNCAGNFLSDGSIIAVIGEKPSGPSPFQRSYPFNDTTGCSGWLNNLLARARIDEGKLFWVNAFNLDGSENDPSMVTELKPKKVICLGKVAEKWAKKNGWDPISFPHPQFWKRFKSKEPYPFIDFLSSVATKS